MSQSKFSGKDSNIVVAIPCYNEAITIGKVVGDFKQALPDAEIIVFDNNSSDESGLLAKDAGAHVRKVRNQGKGYVLQAIFDAIDVDAIVLVDGDDTYFSEDVHRLLAPVLAGEVDMVVGDRLPSASDETMRKHRHLGNKLIVSSIGIPGFLPERSVGGWPDIEVGGPGFCFPVIRWNGEEYRFHRYQYVGTPCKPD